MNIFIDTEDMEERYGEELYKEYLEKENKRLNNTLNEIEAIVYADISNIDCRISIQEKLDKLKELEGKNEKEN